MSATESWYEEKQSAWLYRRVAQVESDPLKKRLFNSLAVAADEQAEIWLRTLPEQPGENFTVFHPTLRAKIVAALIKILGPKAIRPVLAAMKVRGISVYSAPTLRGDHVMPTTVAEVRQGHQVPSGGNLRAAVFGVNDGLISNTSLILGVAGATHDAAIILLTGVAGLLAGAFSMAAGEYVSMRSQRELFEYQIGLEKDELEQYPEEEAEELALIYNARGLDMQQARLAAAEMMQDPEQALDTLAREELGLNPDDLGSPIGAALSSFLAFAVGSVVPLIPFLYGTKFHPLGLTVLLAALSLFCIGALLSLFTGRGAASSGFRMLLIGGAAGLVTYLIGSLFGVGFL